MVSLMMVPVTSNGSEVSRSNAIVAKLRTPVVEGFCADAVITFQLENLVVKVTPTLNYILSFVNTTMG